MHEDRGTRMAVGLAFLAGGVVLVSFVPVTRIDCARAGTETRCVVESALLGLHVLERDEIRSVIEARVDRDGIHQEARSYAQYHLVISGGNGSASPRGLRRGDPSDLDEIAARLNEVIGGNVPGPARERSYNAFPNVIGGAMMLIGTMAFSSGARRRT
jgi:hypothetical protein